jgi:hypothetical protein
MDPFHRRAFPFKTRIANAAPTALRAILHRRPSLCEFRLPYQIDTAEGKERARHAIST